MFTLDNTEGFTQDELGLMNQAVDVMVNDGYAEYSAHDRINDNWASGARTLDALVA